MRIADQGILDLQACVDTLIVIPNQNLFRIANEKTTFADAFAMADQVLYSGVACITDLMVKEGLINLDFADVRSIMRGMGKAMMGTGEASGDKRAIQAAEAAIANPLLDEVSMKGAKGLLISITGGKDLTLFEVDEAATRIREEVDQDANIILGATFDDSLEGVIRVSVVATGIDQDAAQLAASQEARLADLSSRISTPSRTTSYGAAAAAAQESRAHAQARPQPAPQPAPAVAQHAPVASLDAARSSAAAAAIEAALELPPTLEVEEVQTQDPNVTISPYQPQTVNHYEAPELDPEPVVAAALHAEAAPPRYVPPEPERPAAMNRPRMPEIKEFPAPIQRVLAGAAPSEEHDEGSKPMSLLRRIAAVGLGRREDEAPASHVQPPRLAQQPARPAVAPGQPVPQVHQHPPHAAGNEFAKRPAQPQHGAAGRLDPQGRVSPQPARQEDDQLEIPAFLRRQP
jgi:cell division protein FtsZ